MLDTIIMTIPKCQIHKQQMVKGGWLRFRLALLFFMASLSAVCSAKNRYAPKLK